MRAATTASARLITLLVLALALAWPEPVRAALPLITDDSGTQGKGKFLFELGGEYDRDSETITGQTVREADYSFAPNLTYGLTETVDVFIGVPYGWQTVSTDLSPTARVNGLSDLVVGLKWRLLEEEGLGLALKPVVPLPMGNDEKGLGTGKVDYGVVFIATQELAPWAFHANIGYLRNENRIEERTSIWHASVAATYAVARGVTLCADVGRETSRDKAAETEPAYALAGIIYTVTEDLDLSLGVKAGLNRAETDYSILPGLTMRF